MLYESICSESDSVYVAETNDHYLPVERRAVTPPQSVKSSSSPTLSAPRSLSPDYNYFKPQPIYDDLMGDMLLARLLNAEPKQEFGWDGTIYFYESPLEQAAARFARQAWAIMNRGFRPVESTYIQSQRIPAAFRPDVPREDVYGMFETYVVDKAVAMMDRNEAYSVKDLYTALWCLSKLPVGVVVLTEEEDINAYYSGWYQFDCSYQAILRQAIYGRANDLYSTNPLEASINAIDMVFKAQASYLRFAYESAFPSYDVHMLVVMQYKACAVKVGKNDASWKKWLGRVQEDEIREIVLGAPARAV